MTYPGMLHIGWWWVGQGLWQLVDLVACLHAEPTMHFECVVVSAHAQALGKGAMVLFCAVVVSSNTT